MTCNTWRLSPAGACLALALSVMALPAAAAETSLLYVGAGVGQANTRVSQIDYNTNDFGWKATVGTRPLSWLGAELSYVDFGKPDRTINGVYNSASINGATAYGLVYLPLPVPQFDVYAKAGLARLHTTANAAQTGCGLGSCPLFALDRNNTEGTYGLGGQVHFGPVAARIEYEHYETTGGSPTLLTVGVTYSFL